jgi:hypothetical protein
MDDERKYLCEFLEVKVSMMRMVLMMMRRRRRRRMTSTG